MKQQIDDRLNDRYGDNYRDCGTGRDLILGGVAMDIRSFEIGDFQYKMGTRAQRKCRTKHMQSRVGCACYESIGRTNMAIQCGHVEFPCVAPLSPDASQHERLQ